MDASLQRVTNDIQNLRKLFLERIDLLPHDEMLVAYHLNRYNKEAQQTGKDVMEFAQLEKTFEFPFEGKGRTLAFSLDTSEDLVNAFRASFQKLEQPGVFEELRAKYLQ